MSAKPEADWIQLGWKVYYHVDGVTTVYSSKTHNWNDLPVSGVQLLVRYYQKGDNKWREFISSHDFYTESFSVLDSLIDTNPLLKICTEDTNSDLYWAKDAAIKTADNVTIDQSIEKYVSATKTMVGWRAYYSNNTYTKNFSRIPSSGILYLVKYWDDGVTQWKEVCLRQDMYTLNRSDELQIANADVRIKIGSVINEKELASITDMALADVEVF